MRASSAALRRASVILLTVSATLVAVRSVWAYEVLTVESGAANHWAAPTIGVGVDPAWPSGQFDPETASAAIAMALDGWNDALEGRHVLSPSEAPALRVRFEHASWSADRSMLAYTIGSVDDTTGVLVAAVIHVNERDHQFAILDDDATADQLQRDHDLPAVLAHEVGHALGLAHSRDAHAALFPTIGPGERWQRIPQSDDRAGLAFLYAPMGGVSAAAAAGCAIGGAVGSDMSAIVLMGVLLVAMARRRTAARV